MMRLSFLYVVVVVIVVYIFVQTLYLISKKRKGQQTLQFHFYLYLVEQFTNRKISETLSDVLLLNYRSFYYYEILKTGNSFLEMKFLRGMKDK